MFKGNYLKHIKYTFLAPEAITLLRAKKIIEFLIKEIGMNLVFIKAVTMPPGFDIIAVIKESHIAFSYWGEVKLCVLDIFSCNDFLEEVLTEHIKKFFNVDKVKIRRIQNSTVVEELKLLELWTG